MDWVNKHLQIVPINTFIDPIFPVENAIITHAHADHAKPGHDNVLATKHTIEIMKIRYGENCANKLLAKKRKNVANMTIENFCNEFIIYMDFLLLTLSPTQI